MKNFSKIVEFNLSDGRRDKYTSCILSSIGKDWKLYKRMLLIRSTRRTSGASSDRLDFRPAIKVSIRSFMQNSRARERGSRCSARCTWRETHCAGHDHVHQAHSVSLAQCLPTFLHRKIKIGQIFRSDRASSVVLLREDLVKIENGNNNMQLYNINDRIYCVTTIEKHWNKVSECTDLCRRL